MELNREKNFLERMENHGDPAPPPEFVLPRAFDHP